MSTETTTITEKSPKTGPAEKAAQSRQIELLTDALANAAQDGTWLNPSGKQAPKLNSSTMSVSPYNALMMALHSDRGGFNSNVYATFNDVRKAGQAVLKSERGVPFNFYRWDTYVNRHNPSDVISKEERNALPADKQSLYKGVRQREVRTMFNIDQTTLQFSDKEGYAKILDTHGKRDIQGNLAQLDKYAEQQFAANRKAIDANLVPIRLATSGISHYHAGNDSVYIPEKEKFADFQSYAQETMRKVVLATGSSERLAREGAVMKGDRTPSEDAGKREALIAELASGVKMVELGLPARISEKNQDLIPYWVSEIKNNPKMMDGIESDLNNALGMITKAENGAKIEKASAVVKEQAQSYVKKPQVSPSEALVLQNILRYGGMNIDQRNFGKDTEKAEAAKKEFMQKFNNLDYYEGQMLYGLHMTKAQEDPELIDVAWTKATSEGARIYDKCTQWLPNPDEQKGSYFIADELDTIPDRKSREFAVVVDGKTGIVDVILPENARSGGDVVMPNGDRRNFWLSPDEVMSAAERKEQNAQVVWLNSPGINKPKIMSALRDGGANYVRFFNKAGLLRYRPDDAYFKDKQVYSAKMDGKDIKVVSRFDVQDAVRRATETTFSRISMLKTDDGKWAMLIKPEGKDSFAVIPDATDTNRYFAAIKMQNDDATEVRQELAQKYFNLANAHPELKTNLFYDQPSAEVKDKLDRVQIFRTRDDKIMIVGTIDGQRQPPREITKEQWQRLWVCDNVIDYKNALAAQVYADQLGLAVKEAIVAEPAAEMAVNESVKEVAVAEQSQEDKEQQEAEKEAEAYKKAEAEAKAKEEAAKASKEEKAKEEKAKQDARDATRSAVNAIITVAMLQRYAQMKEKHPDAVMLFRQGKQYVALRDDVAKVSSVLALNEGMAKVGGRREPFVAFPHNALDGFIPKMVNAGLRVAICEELAQDKSQQQPVTRSR